MASGPDRSLAQTAALAYLESLIQGVAGFQQACLEGARALAGAKAPPALALSRRDLVLDWPQAQAAWREALEAGLNEAVQRVQRGLSPEALPERTMDLPLTLVDDQQVEQDLQAGKMAQTVQDTVQGEWHDLSARLQGLTHTSALAGPSAATDEVYAQAWLWRLVQRAWLASGLTQDHWRTAHPVLSNEAPAWVQAALHQANTVLHARGVRPEINLRPFIRRAADAPVSRSGASAAPQVPAQPTSGYAPVHDETRLLTQTPGLGRPAQGAPSHVLGQLAQVVARHVPGFAATAIDPSAMEPHAAVTVSSGLQQAMGGRVQGPVGPAPVSYAPGVAPTPAQPWSEDREGVQQALQHLQAGKQVLKRAAASPTERATIEVVALMFQSILTEERLPAAIRVWFARLQMPVLRVAVSEPDFFASVSHPARVLIDRMGACVMGFVAQAQHDDDALHREIKRVVQVVEAYPETGRRVFQTVLNEFERFLDGYFREHNLASREGVSLAQQVEQRETWAIQYTIELRKMLERLPVHDGVRHFLFQVWADVMAHSAVRHGPASETTKTLKQAAGDLIWSASAKTSREERAEVLRRLPPLLKTLRDGMAQAGVALPRQDQEIQALNTALAAAFAARSAALPAGVLQEVMASLEALDELLPDLDDVELDDDLLRDLSGHDSDGLEVVAQGGSMPTPAMQGWARELQVGAWFTLDYRGRHEPVQLAWRGLRKQLTLFARPSGPAVLFQLQRLGAFLQAGLLWPMEEESLTTRATRQALTKLEADPSRLLS